MNTFNCVAAAIMLLPLSIYQSLHINFRAVGWMGWAGLLYMAIGSSVGAYTIFYWALRYMSASRVAVISYFQPVVVIVLAALFLGDHPSKYLLIGTAPRPGWRRPRRARERLKTPSPTFIRTHLLPVPGSKRNFFELLVFNFSGELGS